MILFIFPSFISKQNGSLNGVVVSQSYESQVYDEYVIKGNAAILKCNIPSFVSDHVEIIEWIDSNGSHYTRDDNAGNHKYVLCASGASHRVNFQYAY